MIPRRHVAVMLAATLVALATALGGCSSKPPAPTPGPVSTTLDDQTVALNNRGVALMGQFDYPAARAVFRQVVDRAPGWLDGRVNLAIATLNCDGEAEIAEAMQILGDVLTEDPDQLRAHFCLGLLLRHIGRMDEATTHFKVVVEHDPTDAFALLYVGRDRLEKGDPAAALEWFERAGAADPYLRTIYLARAQALQRLDRGEEANEMFERFEQLATNPQAEVVETAYTKMGPKAEVVVAGAVAAPPAMRPAGPVFAPPTPLADLPAGATWAPVPDGDGRSITACDIDGDGRTDLFIAGGLSRDGRVINAVILNRDDTIVVDAAHPLADITDVRAALWGDYDNDGLTDVYLCRRGPNRLMQQKPAGVWADVTDAAGIADDDLDTVDGAIFDADHDGDLDVFCVNADGPNELFNNNLDGTFRRIAADQGLAGDPGRRARQVITADLDHDRDTDLIVLYHTPPHDVFVNDRGWSYHTSPRFAVLAQTPIAAAVIADADADGRVELYTLNDDGLQVWPEDDELWTSDHGLTMARSGSGRPGRLAVADVTGDGRPLILASPDDSWRAVTTSPVLTEAPYPDSGSPEAVASWTVFAEEGSRGPSVVGVRPDGMPLIWRPGSGRHSFVAMRVSGRKDATDMRSNASGIGTAVAMRVGSRWVVSPGSRPTSGPGQSLQPLMLGAGGSTKADFIALTWSDGVYQTELDLAASTVHTIEEKQRQLSSCPVVFAWNGERFEFVSDILGVGGIGFFLSPGEYSVPRPTESFLMPDGLLRPKDGRYLVSIEEPMEEACYLDGVSLVAIDLPPGWSVTLDERMNVAGPAPTEASVFYRRVAEPTLVTNDRGEDVRSSVVVADLVAAPVGARDHRFIGRLSSPHVLTLEFGSPIDDGDPVLVVDGWVEYPYSQTMFAAWQAGASYDAPTIEARGSDGRWVTVL
ncbi:MAG: VCBS repeat-containing protein, partial [Phycisphaerales bacterium]|nr:VCBS repeat-containing protein [Phycisphaerales bacterium]